MTANTIGIVSLQGLILDDMWFPFLVSGTIDPILSLKLAVSLDTTAPNTVKLAAPGDRILGRLEVIEQRSVEGVTIGTVSVAFCDVLVTDGVHTFVVGDTAVGGSVAGQVAPLGGGTPAPDHSQNIVLQVLTGGNPVVLKAGS
jgi:hypothetical protein